MIFSSILINETFTAVVPALAGSSLAREESQRCSLSQSLDVWKIEAAQQSR
jgi:hypothetical protein